MNALLPWLLAVTFVSPQQGAQAVGVLPIEVTTTAANVDRVEFSVDGVLAGVARKPPYRIAHDFGTSLAGHEISAIVFSNGYRTTETAKVLTAALTAAETMNVDLVEVPMRVRAPRPLRAGDLRVRENAVEQTVRDVRAERGPARFVFVVDRSLSMGGGRLASALRAIGSESKLLHAGDRAEVVLFNHNVMKAQPLADVREVEPSGGTALRDALSSIASPERTYAIVITDGGDRNSLTPEEEALRKISGTKMVVDAIVLGGGSRFLDEAARNTGGVIATANATTIDRELRRIIEDINSRYTLVYQSHGNAGGWRAISIKPATRGVEIMNARKGYFAQ
ncbi:MAG TPA: Ig-like domain-containing protein [Thermoanaerobaculia bacterium]|nr:Ig-like domain-containing protein [Thermoanaerobaculia bacterium]